MGSRLRPARRAGLDLARLLRARRRPVHRLARARTARRRRARPSGSTGPTTSRGSTIRAGTTGAVASTCGGTRPTTRATSSASRRRTGDFPGGLKDLNTDNPDVEGGADPRRSSTGSRSPTSTASASTPSSTSIAPRWIATCAASGASSPIACARRRKTLGKQNFFIFGEGVRRQRRSDRQLHVGRHRTRRASSVASTRCSTSRRSTAASTRCSRRASRRRTSSASTTRASAATGPTRAACTNGYPQGPDYQPTPHAASADGGIGLAPQQVLVNFLDNHDLPRFMFEKTDPNDPDASRSTYLHHVGRHPVRLLRHRAGLRRRRRSEEPRGHVPRQRGARLRAVRDRPRARSSYVQGADPDAQGQRRAAPRHGRRRCGRRRSTARAATPASSRSSASAPASRPRSSCSTRARRRARRCAPVSEGGACLKTTLPAGTTLTDVMPGGDGATFTVKSDGTVAVTVPAALRPRARRIDVAPARVATRRARASRARRPASRDQHEHRASSRRARAGPSSSVEEIEGGHGVGDQRAPEHEQHPRRPGPERGRRVHRDARCDPDDEIGGDPHRDSIRVEAGDPARDDRARGRARTPRRRGGASALQRAYRGVPVGSPARTRRRRCRDQDGAREAKRDVAEADRAIWGITAAVRTSGRERIRAGTRRRGSVAADAMRAPRPRPHDESGHDREMRSRAGQAHRPEEAGDREGSANASRGCARGSCRERAVTSPAVAQHTRAAGTRSEPRARRDTPGSPPRSSVCIVPISANRVHHGDEPRRARGDHGRDTEERDRPVGAGARDRAVGRAVQRDSRDARSRDRCPTSADPLEDASSRRDITMAPSGDDQPAIVEIRRSRSARRGRSVSPSASPTATCGAPSTISVAANATGCATIGRPGCSA